LEAENVLRLLPLLAKTRAAAASPLFRGTVQHTCLARWWQPCVSRCRGHWLQCSVGMAAGCADSRPM